MKGQIHKFPMKILIGCLILIFSLSSLGVYSLFSQKQTDINVYDELQYMSNNSTVIKEIMNDVDTDLSPKYASANYKPVRANIIQNSSFENMDNTNLNTIYPNSYSSSYNYVNFSYTENVNSGQKAAQHKSQAGTINWGSTYMNHQWNQNEVMLNETLNFSVNIFIHDDKSIELGANIYTMLIITNGLGTFYYFYFYYVNSSILTNSSYYRYYIFNCTLGNWQSMNINITGDFTTFCGNPSGYFVYQIYNYIDSPPNIDYCTECIWDNITLNNSTNHQYILNPVLNRAPFVNILQESYPED